MIDVNGSEINLKEFYRQEEVAKLLCRSVPSIINYRKKGRLPFQMFPFSNIPLYPIKEIDLLVSKYTYLPKEVIVPKAKAVVRVSGKPMLSSNTTAQWRIPTWQRN